MELFYRKSGLGKPMVILHGLYGSSDNWMTIAKAMSSNFEVFLPDQRNHGHSSHSEEHNYEVMSEDLYEFVSRHQLKNFVLLGHSMGGKTAMYFANNYPEVLSHLIVADIAPRSYDYNDLSLSGIIDHQAIINVLLSLDLKKLKNRNEAEDYFRKRIKSTVIRMFLLKSLQRNEILTNPDTPLFKWRFNLDVLYRNLGNIFNGFDNFTSNNFIIKTKTLFIKGKNSNYIEDADLDRIKLLFKDAQLSVINGAGHFLHIEQPGLFVEEVLKFTVF